MTSELDFQRQFDVLIEPDLQEIEEYVFHVNTQKLLSSAYNQHKALVPYYILKGLEFDESMDIDDLRVCFIGGQLEYVSKFLAGHILANDVNNFQTIKDFYKSPSALYRKNAICVAKKGDCSQITKHNILNFYSNAFDSPVLPMYSSFVPVPILQVIPINIFQLTKSQAIYIKHEGGVHYDSGNFSEEELCFPLPSKKVAEQVYFVARYYELLTKYALIDFIHNS